MKKYTKTGTDIEEVKKRNSQSGYTYNEAKQILAEQYAKQNQSNSK